MSTQKELYKGELMEELLRNYFLGAGYYVARGIKFKYKGLDVTDVDLFLYKRTSILTRERINVDIKNKKSPSTFERILWANGVKALLKFDTCIVATTDTKELYHKFSNSHETIFLDGAFLTKMRAATKAERIYEEDFLKLLSDEVSYNKYQNKSWKVLYETSKSRLLSEQDYSGVNETLLLLKYLIEKLHVDKQKLKIATRFFYAILSHLLINLDYLLKDISFLEQQKKEQKMYEGFQYGNLGKEGVDKILGMAMQIAGSANVSKTKDLIEDKSLSVLSEFFTRNDIAKQIFNWAIDLEAECFRHILHHPNELNPQQRGLIALLLDYFGFNRAKFYELFPKIELH